MATGENPSSLYGVLYHALTDPELIGDLLQHPEFRHQARQICDRIAGPADGEDLLREVCLRVAERVSHLKPDTMRNEREFFRWFSLLARRVHLSWVLGAAAVRSCTEKAEGWPDSPADVPPDDMGRFLAHADGCPYHTRLLRAWDEKLRAIFRRARGADSRGRILGEAELHTSIAEHKHRLQNWREAAFKKGGQFGHVALYNGDAEVATCGRNFDFSNHVSRNELDPYAGLQIRGVTSRNPDEDVLLGFYALAGVRHGGLEKTLELDNGYTVCLTVKQVGDTSFEVHFRCVETKGLEATPASTEEAEDGSVIDMTGDGGLPGPPASLVHPPPLPAEMPVPPGWSFTLGLRAAATIILVVLVAVPCFMAGRKWGQEVAVEGGAQTQAQALLEGAPVPEAPAGGLRLARAQAPQVTPPLPAPTPAGVKENLSPRAANAPTRRGPAPTPSAGRPTRGSERRALTPLRAATGSGDGRETFASRQDPDMEAVQRIEDRIADRQPVPRQTVLPKPRFADKVDYEWSAPAGLRAYDDSGDAVGTSRRTSTGASLRKASYEDREDSPDTSVLHTATNDTLVRKIDGALRHLHIRVEPVAERNPAARFRVMWVARTESSWRKKSFVVKLNVYIYRGGEKNSAHHLSTIGVGKNLDAAYDIAIGDAVKPIVEWIRTDSGRMRSEKRLHATAVGAGESDQPVANPPKDALAEGNKDRGVIRSRRPRSEPGATGRGEDVNAGPMQAEDSEENSLEE